MKRLIAFAFCALLLGGCGGARAGGSEAGPVSAVVNRYFSAFARGDGPGLCALLTPGAQATMVAVVDADEREAGRAGGPRSCTEAARSFGPVTLFDDAKVLSVSISGDAATAKVKVGGLHEASVTLSRTAEGWVLSKLPGQD